MLQRFLLVWLSLLSLVAWAWPEWVKPQLGFDPFLATAPRLMWLIALLMFCIGGLMQHDEIRQVLRRWPEVLFGVCAQYGSMPLLALGAAWAFGLEGALFSGVILVGCVPGAMASNVLTLAARGNVSYSVSLTTAATLLSPLFVPAALYLTLHQTVSNPEALAKQAFFDLLTQVVLPVLAGHLLSRRIEAAARFMNRFGAAIANALVLWIIAVVVNVNHARFGQAAGPLVGALVALNLLGYAAGGIAGRLYGLPEAKTRALTIEIGMQNAGLGATLARQLFPGQELVALPPALFTFGCMLTGTMLAQWWSRRAPAEEPAARA